jgi:hypothetical protein
VLRKFALLLSAFVSLACAGAEPRLACGPGEQERALRALAASPVKQLAFWKGAFAQPLEQRVRLAPREVIDLIALDNLYHGYPEHPHAATMTDDLRADVIAALEAIPEPIKRRLSQRLAGILFVDDFGGTGFTDSIADEKGRKTRAFVVLDPMVLEQRTANAWATWKDNTPFRADGRHELKTTIEHPSDDNRRQAIQYILLHELGHVLAVGEQFHPDWNLKVSEIRDEDYPFFDLSWSLDRSGDRYAARFDKVFPERKDVAFYFGAKLAAADMSSTYAHLELTNFPTLYAATSPGDDFAESFANYVHVVMMGKPYSVVLTEDGRVVKRYGPCWGGERCAAKRRILEAFLR